MSEEARQEREFKFPLTPIRALIASIGIYISSQILAVFLVAAYGYSQGQTNETIDSWIESSPSLMFVVYLLIAAIAIPSIGMVIRFSKKSWRSIGLNKPEIKDALYAVVGYGYYLPLFFLASILIGLLFPGVDFEQQQQLGFSTSLVGKDLLAVFVSLVVLPPIYEEILARGLLYTGLRSGMRFLPAALITSALFAAAHLQWGSDAPLLWAAAIDTFVLSMVLVTLREKTGSLWPAIGLHAIKNLVAFSLLFIFKIG